MGADGYLVNIARGSVVDEDALVEALAEGRLAGAGLDVFADEPNVPEALLTMDNVVVLPHVGSGTVQTRAAMEALTLRNLDSFLASGAAGHAGADAGYSLRIVENFLPAKSDKSCSKLGARRCR